jgi:hypothetical protein
MAGKKVAAASLQQQNFLVVTTELRKVMYGNVNI